MGFSEWRATARIDRTPCGLRYAAGRADGPARGELLLARSAAQSRRLRAAGGLLERLGAGGYGRHLPEVVARSEGAGSVRCALLAASPPAPRLSTAGRLGSGAVVTVFVPIAELLGAVHLAGAVHGSIGAAAIRLHRERGPLLGEWWSGRPVRGAAGRRAVLGEWRAFAGLLDGVARACRPDEGAEPYPSSLVAAECARLGRGRSLPGLHGRAGAAEDPAELAARFVDALFEWSPATPLPSPGERPEGAAAPTPAGI
ncbi:MAG: hypothetical protein Q4E05_05270 [Pseudoclavibacter sp.]|nr:hypothetical protein [Pseudoclavibacter sp.]